MRLRSSSFDKKLISSGRFSIKFGATKITESIKVDVEKKSITEDFYLFGVRFTGSNFIDSRTLNIFL